MARDALAVLDHLGWATGNGEKPSDYWDELENYWDFVCTVYIMYNYIYIHTYVYIYIYIIFECVMCVCVLDMICTKDMYIFMADPAVESPVSLKTSPDRSKEKVHIIGISMGGMIAQASWKIHQFFDEKILIFHDFPIPKWLVLGFKKANHV
jgi:hypothetical protein